MTVQILVLTEFSSISSLKKNPNDYRTKKTRQDDSSRAFAFSGRSLTLTNCRIRSHINAFNNCHKKKKTVLTKHAIVSIDEFMVHKWLTDRGKVEQFELMGENAKKV